LVFILKTSFGLIIANFHINTFMKSK